jgi:hypothetical protein
VIFLTAYLVHIHRIENIFLLQGETRIEVLKPQTGTLQTDSRKLWLGPWCFDASTQLMRCSRKMHVCYCDVQGTGVLELLCTLSCLWRGANFTI